MPVSTVRYRFEYRLFDWAEEHVRGLTGDRLGLFVGMREDGTLRRVYVAAPGRPWDGEQKTSMAAAHPRWFLFVPDDEPGRGYLEWSALPVAVAQRWLTRPLQSTDLQDVKGDTPLDHWPETWRVVLY